MYSERGSDAVHTIRSEAKRFPRRVTRTQVQLAASIIKLKRSRLGGRIKLQQECHLSAERTKQPNIITQHRLLESAIETTGLMFFISHRAHHRRETPPDDTGPKNTGPQPSRNCAPPPKKKYIKHTRQRNYLFFIQYAFGRHNQKHGSVADMCS